MPTLAQKEQIIQETGIDKKRLEGWFFRYRKKLQTNNSQMLQPSSVTSMSAMQPLTKPTEGKYAHLVPSPTEGPTSSNGTSSLIHAGVAGIPASRPQKVLGEDELKAMFASSKPAEAGVVPTASSNSSAKGLTEEAKAYLTRWLSEHSSHPYPTRQEKNSFLTLLGITEEKKLDGFLSRGRKKLKNEEEAKKSASSENVLKPSGQGAVSAASAARPDELKQPHQMSASALPSGHLATKPSELKHPVQTEQAESTVKPSYSYEPETYVPIIDVKERRKVQNASPPKQPASQPPGQPSSYHVTQPPAESSSKPAPAETPLRHEAQRETDASPFASLMSAVKSELGQDNSAEAGNTDTSYANLGPREQAILSSFQALQSQGHQRASPNEYQQPGYQQSHGHHQPAEYSSYQQQQQQQWEGQQQYVYPRPPEEEGGYHQGYNHQGHNQYQYK